MKRFGRVFAAILCTAVLFACSGRNRTIVTPAPDPAQEETSDVIALVTPDPDEKPSRIPTSDPTPVQSPAPTPEPTDESPAYVAKDGIDTIAWISDPQHYSEQFPETYYAMTAFLRDHSAQMNLAYIINTGDLVNDPEVPEQWDVADRAQSMIDGIPNGVLAGNHDVLEPVGYTAFSEYFGEERYRNNPWYGGSYENNRGHFDLLTLGETDYVFVYMGFGPDNAAIDWVETVFRTYPDRIGVLCLHDYYTKTLTLSEDGQRWYDRIVRTTPNLYLVLCGHKYGSYCFPESFDDDGDGKKDRTVYQMLFNYQATKHDGGAGYLRLIQIDEAEGTMQSLTYSPLLDDFNRFDDPENREKYYEFDERNEEFQLPLPWMMQNQ